MSSIAAIKLNRTQEAFEGDHDHSAKLLNENSTRFSCSNLHSNLV